MRKFCYLGHTPTIASAVTCRGLAGAKVHLCSIYHLLRMRLHPRAVATVLPEWWLGMQEEVSFVKRDHRNIPAFSSANHAL